MHIHTAIERAHHDNKYGLTFVQNYVMLGSLRNAPIGFFLLVGVLLMFWRETYWFLLLHFIFCLSVATVLGIWNAQKRYTFLKKNFSEYNKLGKRYLQLCDSAFHYSGDMKFAKDVFKLRWHSGEYYTFALLEVTILILVFVPWFLILSKYSMFFKKDFQSLFYPFCLACGTFTIYRFARFFYWKVKLATLIQKEYGYTYHDLRLDIDKA